MWGYRGFEFPEESAVLLGYPLESVDSDPVLVVTESFDDLACLYSIDHCSCAA